MGEKAKENKVVAFLKARATLIDIALLGRLPLFWRQGFIC